MSNWTAEELDAIGASDECRSPCSGPTARCGLTTIWVVRVGEDLYVRSYRGRDGIWFQSAYAARGPYPGRRVDRDVTFSGPDRADHGAIDRPTISTPVRQHLVHGIALEPGQRPCGSPPADGSGRSGALQPEPFQIALKEEKTMRGTMLYAPARCALRGPPRPEITEPTDAIIRLSATCVCGSDLWPYRGIEEVDGPAPMGHEYCGIVEEVGRDVRTIKPGQFVVGSFFISDNTCPICRAGYQSPCVHREPVGPIGTQAESYVSRWPTAPWSPRQDSGRRPDSRACSRPPTCSAPAGSEPWPPRPDLAKPSRSSVTAPWACSPSSPASNSALSGSSQ